MQCHISCVTVTDGRQIEINSGGLSARDGQKSFAFDHVFDQGSAQQELFDKLAVPLVQNVINGDPATIFCYGQVCF